MSDAILPSDYKSQWPALFVEWAGTKLAEWEARDRTGMTATQRQKLDYDISTLRNAIELVRAYNDRA